jgi:hypothetical protein
MARTVLGMHSGSDRVDRCEAPTKVEPRRRGRSPVGRQGWLDAAERPASKGRHGGLRMIGILSNE